MAKNKYMVINIREYLQRNENGENEELNLKKILSDFSCPLNVSIEQFLKEQAIDFTKKNQSVTYLVFCEEDASLVGYFTLATKPIEVKSGILSKTVQRKLSRVGEYNEERQTYHLSAYLIAQFGKNFKENVNFKITGQELMSMAKNKIKDLQYMLGGMVAFLETEVEDKLLKFYAQENDFKQFDKRISNSTNNKELIQMLITL